MPLQLQWIAVMLELGSINWSAEQRILYLASTITMSSKTASRSVPGLYPALKWLA